jgi:hypothetical protein
MLGLQVGTASSFPLVPSIQNSTRSAPVRFQEEAWRNTVCRALSQCIRPGMRVGLQRCPFRLAQCVHSDQSPAA